MRRAIVTAVGVGCLLSSSAVFGGWEEGVAAFKAGQYAVAAETFESVAEQHPQFAAAHYMHGLSLLRAEHPEQAVASLARAVDLSETAADRIRYQLDLAAAQLGSGTPQVALATLDTLDPRQLSAEAAIAYAGRLAQVSAALEDQPPLAELERAASLLPDQTALWVALGRARAREENFVAASIALETARRLDPQDASIAGQLGLAALRASEALEGSEAARWRATAIEAGEAAARDRGDYADLLVAGSARLAAKELEQARAWFEQAAELEPAAARPLLEQARCAAAAEEWADALALARRAEQAQPEVSLQRGIDRVAASAAWGLHDFTEAARRYRRAGDEAAARRAEEAGRIAAGNGAWEAEVAKCRVRQKTLAQLASELGPAADPTVRAELATSHAAFVRECEAYLPDLQASEPAG